MAASDSSSGLRVADGLQARLPLAPSTWQQAHTVGDGELQSQPLQPVSLGFEAYRKRARAS